MPQRQDSAAMVDFAYSDMGLQTYKNITEPMRAWICDLKRCHFVASAAYSCVSAQSLALPDKPSIAILAFQNMSGDAEQEYFADGIAEDIITRFPNRVGYS
jgi:adenylate cyclase